MKPLIPGKQGSDPLFFDRQHNIVYQQYGFGINIKAINRKIGFGHFTMRYLLVIDIKSVGSILPLFNTKYIIIVYFYMRTNGPVLERVSGIVLLFYNGIRFSTGDKK